MERIVNRTKKDAFMDALYATQTVMGLIDQYNWKFVINLSKSKLKEFTGYCQMVQAAI